jgi:hypothetical protein
MQFTNHIDRLGAASDSSLVPEGKVCVDHVLMVIRHIPA